MWTYSKTAIIVLDFYGNTQTRPLDDDRKHLYIDDIRKPRRKTAERRRGGGGRAVIMAAKVAKVNVFTSYSS